MIRFHKNFFWIIISLEIIGILIIGSYLYTTVALKKSVLGSKIIYTPVSKTDIISSPSSEFKYYYGLPSSTTLIEKRFWDNSSAHLTINKDGLNDRFDYSTEKTPNTYRIITLGDSFTYGSRIDTKFNWTEQLEDLLVNSCSNQKKYEVINLGVWGYDIPYIIKRYEDVGMKYNADLIIWFESGSGFYRDRERINSLAQQCEDNVRSKSNSSNISSSDIESCSVDAENEINNTTTPKGATKRVFDWMYRFFNLTKETPVVIASGYGIDLDHKQVIQSLIDNYKNLFYIDNMPAIGQEEGTALSEYDYHPNEKGHQLIANSIYKFIMSKSELEVSCNTSN